MIASMSVKKTKKTVSNMVDILPVACQLCRIYWQVVANIKNHTVLYGPLSVCWEILLCQLFSMASSKVGIGFALHRTLSFYSSLPLLQVWASKDCFRPEFLKLKITDIFGLHNSLLQGSYPAHSRICSSIPGLYPLDTSNIL